VTVYSWSSGCSADCRAVGCFSRCKVASDLNLLALVTHGLADIWPLRVCLGRFGLGDRHAPSRTRQGLRVETPGQHDMGAGTVYSSRVKFQATSIPLHRTDFLQQRRGGGHGATYLVV